MAALSAARNTQSLGAPGQPKLMNYPVKGSTTIYAGSMVAITSSGLAAPMTHATTWTAVGRAAATADNSSGADSAITVQVLQGCFAWDQNGTAFAQSDVGAICYGYDDHTVTKSSSGSSVAGVVYQVDATGVWVMTSLPMASLPIDLATFESTLAGTGGAALVGVLDTDTNFGASPTVETALAAAMETTRSVISCPIPAYSAIANSGVLLRLTPGYKGRILGMHVQATTAVTTSSKVATLTPKIAGTSVTGGVVSMTSAGQNAIGAVQDGTAVSAANTFTAAQEITVVASSVTAFVEGAGVIYLVLG